MTLIRRTNPLGELISLRRTMDRQHGDHFDRARVTAPGNVKARTGVADPATEHAMSAERDA